MKTIATILFIGLIISVLMNILIIKETRDISKSLDFLANNNTQMRLTNSFRIKSLEDLSQNINKFLDSFHKKEQAYILNEKNLQTTIRGLSHDIRTPLTSLDGYLQLLEKSDDPKDKKKYLTIMENRIKSLNKILDQLFTFVKLQEEEYKLDLEEVDIKRTALDTLLNYYEDFTFREIEPTIDFQDKDMVIEANRDALERIFQNIYKNILEHGTNPIRLSLIEKDDEIIFLSENKIKSGEKILEDQIFKEFYKADSSRKGSSTGLGLPITKSLVEKLGGEISARVHENSFKIKLVFKKIC